MKRLFQSLSRTNDGAFIIDSHHRIIFWNKAAEQILGYTAEEAIGRPCYEILGGRDEQGRTLCQRYCRIAIKAERGDILPNQDVNVNARTHTGEEHWLNVTTFAYQVTDKSTSHVIVHLFRDTTEQKSYQHFADQVLLASERLQQVGSNQIISSSPKEHRANGLTAREWQVLRLMAQGQGTGEIAGTLSISPSTVRNHAQNVLDKLGVHSRLEAISYAYQHGLIESNEM